MSASTHNISTPGIVPLNPSYIGARPDVLAMMPREFSSVLDVGCSTGAVGRDIKELNRTATVTGVEYNATMADMARRYLDEVFEADLNRTPLSAVLEDRHFDVIVFADVLEHLINPWSVLADATRLLQPNGCILTSLPNVAHISTFTNLLFRDRWPLNPRGIHDKTHLRWFTRKNIHEMFEECGLRSVDERRNMRFFEGPTRYSQFNRYARWCHFFGFGRVFVFQYLHRSILK